MRRHASRLGLLRRFLEDAEGRPVRQLVELGVDAAERVGAMLIGALDLGRADRQRLAYRPDRAEPVPPPAGPFEQGDIDADPEDALGAADVAPAEGGVRIHVRAVLLEAPLRIDDLLADDAASPALDLVSLLDQRQ